MNQITEIKKHIDSLQNKILELLTFEEKINAIASYTKIVTAARRCSIFIFKSETSELESIYNDGITEHIILRSNVGLVGYAFHKQKTVLENDVNTNPIFFKSIDKKFHFTTRNILAVPILDEKKNTIGVIQLLNKKLHFNQNDQNHIEILIPLLASVLTSHTSKHKEIKDDQLSTPKIVQKTIGDYLENKKLYLMDNGYAYYKLLDMGRNYFIGADTCYQLSTEAKKIELYYYDINNIYEKITVTGKLDSEKGTILISLNQSKEEYISYDLESEF
ncbi:MAG TPA: GAF domain-containing protein [Epsilonproteobacteria bacterium]|nr:GAF domain-containing protein [Campylobacterota bacterium]HHD79763.1 GAF domain-containing protein [Campylobacterota bacterium]